MTHLTHFAFLHAFPSEQLALFRDVVPEVCFLHAERGALPLAIEAVEAASIGGGSFDVDDLLARAPRLRWLHSRGAGVDALITRRLADSDVILTNSSGVHGVNIAEHLLSLMLAFARQLPLFVRAQDQREWAKPPVAQLFELSGQTLAVIGLGAIGQALAVRAAALGMQVVGVRRHAGGALPAGVARLVDAARLDDALQAADHVAITLPLTDETRGLFSRGRLHAIKRGAYLYNIGRGAIVDHDALLEALRSGHLGGAGLDVTDPEPLPAESPLWGEPNVLITAHTSGRTPASFDRYKAILVDNLHRFQRGDILLNVVDKHLGY